VRGGRRPHPLARPLGPVRGLLRARVARQPDRGRERGLRPHRACEGALASPRAPAPHAAHLDDTFVSLFGLDFGFLVGGGALLTEVVFGLPGVGLLTYQSLTALDLPVIMGTVFYAAFFITLASAAVDVLYAWLDPRVRPS
jgi:hypothetical protein